MDFPTKYAIRLGWLSIYEMPDTALLADGMPGAWYLGHILRGHAIFLLRFAKIGVVVVVVDVPCVRQAYFLVSIRASGSVNLHLAKCVCVALCTLCFVYMKDAGVRRSTNKFIEGGHRHARRSRQFNFHETKTTTTMSSTSIELKTVEAIKCLGKQSVILFGAVMQRFTLDHFHIPTTLRTQKHTDCIDNAVPFAICPPPYFGNILPETYLVLDSMYWVHAFLILIEPI